MQKARLEGRGELLGFFFGNLIQVLGVSQATENVVVNNTGMTPVFLEPTVYPSMTCATGKNACPQL